MIKMSESCFSLIRYMSSLRYLSLIWCLLLIRHMSLISFVSLAGAWLIIYWSSGWGVCHLWRSFSLWFPVCCWSVVLVWSWFRGSAWSLKVKLLFCHLADLSRCCSDDVTDDLTVDASRCVRECSADGSDGDHSWSWLFWGPEELQQPQLQISGLWYSAAGQSFILKAKECPYISFSLKAAGDSFNCYFLKATESYFNSFVLATTGSSFSCFIRKSSGNPSKCFVMKSKLSTFSYSESYKKSFQLF